MVEKTDGYVVCEMTAGWCVVATDADPNKYSPEADARLIAAAPDLMQALKIISVWAQNPEPDTTSCLKLIHDKAMEYIAKAKVEQG
jgi:hypothetical protein